MPRYPILHAYHPNTDQGVRQTVDTRGWRCMAYQYRGNAPINDLQSISNVYPRALTSLIKARHRYLMSQRTSSSRIRYFIILYRVIQSDISYVMPLYDIEHVIPLSDDQQEALAKAFTSLHCTRFHTPSFFINVRFTDVSSQKVYRGGVLRYYNRAILRTRVSENRTTEQYGEHCLDLMKVWDEIIVPASVDSEHEKSLRTVWIMGTLTTAVEMGFQRPAAGQEIKWLKDNKDEFEKMAKEGDEDMQQLMVELQTRKDFADVMREDDAIHRGKK